jgi:hypothetical protein
MTVKVFDTPDTYSLVHVYTTDHKGKVTNDYVAPLLSGEKRGRKAGANTPHFHERIKKGEFLPLNSYSRWDYELKAIEGSRTWDNLSQPQWGGSNYPYAHLPYRMLGGEPRSDMCGNPFEGVDTMLLLTQAIADAAPSLDVLTTAAEAAKTAEMVVTARSTAKDLIAQARRGGFNTVKAAASAWMQWRYGWTTLGYDMQAIYELLRKPGSHTYVTGQAGTDSTSDISGAGTRSPRTEGYFSYEYSGSVDTSLRARVTAKWDGKTQNFALVNPLVTAWELVPYSWVADWFVSVGDTLKAWHVLSQVMEIHASLGWKTTAHAEFAETAIAAAGWSHTGNWGWTETFDSRGRIPISIPFIVPSITVDLTTKRILDVAAMCARRID